VSAQAQAVSATTGDIAERRRARALHSLRVSLEALAVDADRIASMGDREALKALEAFDAALETIRGRGEALQDEFHRRIDQKRDEETE